MTKARVEALDGVRGIAIAGVMLLHISIEWFYGGGVGVDVFFALSAFLITTLLLREHVKAGRVSFRSFYARRALRLGPALIIFLTLIAPPAAIVNGNSDAIFGSTVACLLYISNFAYVFGWIPVGPEYAHLWSLAVEEQFYIVWPAVLVFLLAKGRAQLSTLLAMALPLGALLQLYTSVHDWRTYYLPWGHAIPLLGGCLLAVVLAAPPSGVARWIGQLVRWTTGTVGACTALGVLVVAMLAMDHVSWHGPALGYAAGGAAGVVLVGHAATRTRGFVIQILTMRVLLWLGTRSYGLYLYHRTLLIFAFAVFPGVDRVVTTVVATIVSFIVAEMSFRLVEVPIQTRGRAWLAARAQPVNGSASVR